MDINPVLLPRRPESCRNLIWDHLFVLFIDDCPLRKEERTAKNGRSGEMALAKHLQLENRAWFQVQETHDN